MDWLLSQTKLFRAMLHCYPAEFRHEYGAEMERLFVGRLRSESRVRVWMEAIADTGTSALVEHWHILKKDVTYGSRTLAATPGFTALSLLVISLGIGVTASIFSLVNAVLLRSLPYGHSSQLMYLWSPNPRLAGVPEEMAPNYPDLYDWQRLSRSFTSIAAVRESMVNVGQNGRSDRLSAAFVSGNFFRTMEVRPELGHEFGDDETQPGHRHVALISTGLWASRFGSNPQTLGQQMEVNREHYTIIGIMPMGFSYPNAGEIPYASPSYKRTDIWLPLVQAADQKTNRAVPEDPDAAIGRLRAGVSRTQAQAELQAIEGPLNSLYPDMWKGWTALVRPVEETIVGPVKKLLWLLFAAAGLLMLIALSNVANLFLARASTRAHELGIRSALGAERSRIVRQLLTESTMLSCAGGLAGICFAYFTVRALTRLNPGGIPRLESASVDGQVLSMCVALSLLTGLLCGISPAVSASRLSVSRLLARGGGRTGGSSNSGRRTLLVVEVSLSLVLVIGSGLLLRSYLRLLSVNPGFSASTLTFSVSLDEQYRTPGQRAALYKQFLARVQNMRGVTYAGSSNSIPLSGRQTAAFAEIRGVGRSKELVSNPGVTPDYRKALGMILLGGRDFDVHDIESKTPVLLVNERFVHTYLKGRDALGTQIRMGIADSNGKGWGGWATVVGVVADVRQSSLEATSKPEIYQASYDGSQFALQGVGPVSGLLQETRAVLRSLDPTLTLEDVHSMADRMTEDNSRRTFQTSLLTAFAAIAMILALTGLYGLVSYSVKQRTAEIGVRLALGSSRVRILHLILLQGLRLTMLGVTIGLAGSYALAHAIRSWLFEVPPIDPVTFGGVPLLFLLIAGCACAIPAWNATRINPTEALRQE